MEAATLTVCTLVSVLIAKETVPRFVVSIYWTTILVSVAVDFAVTD